MRSLVVWFKDTLEVITSRPEQKGNKLYADVLVKHIPDWQTRTNSRWIDGSYTTHEFKDAFEITTNQQIIKRTVPPEQAFYELKAEKINKIQESFIKDTQSVICYANGVEYVMDAAKGHVDLLDGGIRLLQLNLAKAGIPESEAVMDIRDFHNTDHPNVPFPDCLEIVLQMGNNFAAKRMRKNAAVDSINGIDPQSPTAIQELMAINY